MNAPTVEIHLVNEGRTIRAFRGQTLLEVQIAAGLQPDAPCGGQGICGKCLTEIRRPGETLWNTVRACRTAVDEDLELRSLPQEPKIRVLSRGETIRPGRWEPWVRVLELQVPPCPAGESVSDWARLKLALETVSGIREWLPDMALASRLAGLLKQTGGHLWAAVTRTRILDLYPLEPRIYMAAFDLGTTSIAGYLLDETGTAARAGMRNPQIQYGADVIQRANYALEQGTDALADCVRQAINTLLGELCGNAGIHPDEILAVSLVGNTCMHHLFLGISPESLAHAPYQPAISESAVLRAADYGLLVHPNADLLMLPVIAGFVGADTVSCLLAGDWESREELTLLIDIGTNGEIVLGNRHRIIACSTAAGPAFEGAGIQCGMRGANGAVDHVFWENGRLAWSVIGGGEAQGLCGSGLIDLIAVLRQTGDIDESGYLTAGPVYQLENTKVFLTQKDIRQVQLAKGAICAGICLLAEKYGTTLENIRQVHIAGAFGSSMNPDSACRIGLIPGPLRSKIRAVGNAAGEGAQMVLRDRNVWDLAERLARQAEFLELGTLPEFQDAFVDALEFPEL